MFYRNSIGALALAASLTAAIADAPAAGDTPHSEFAGQWVRNVGAQWDPAKPRGSAQQAPLIAEYQAILGANLAEQRSGGDTYNPQAKCVPSGMPRMMIAYEPIELIITPEITYVWVEQMGEFRRIYMAPTPPPIGPCSSQAPQFTEANVYHLIVRHGARQMADGLRKSIETDDRLLGDDRVVEAHVALDGSRDKRRGIGREFALPDLPRQGRVGAQGLLRLDDRPHGRLDACRFALDVAIGGRHGGEGEMTHISGIVAAAHVDENLAGPAADGGLGAEGIGPEAVDQARLQGARREHAE
jgi:hypothetical protein